MAHLWLRYCQLIFLDPTKKGYIISVICEVVESAHVKKQGIVIFSIPIFHTLRPHTLPSKRVKMRWAFLLHTKINLKHSQDCVGLAFPFCTWAWGCPQGSCNWWVHCSHPRTAQDPDANRWFGSIVLDQDFPHPGIPDLGIPPLDPFEVPHFDIDPIE